MTRPTVPEAIFEECWRDAAAVFEGVEAGMPDEVRSLLVEKDVRGICRAFFQAGYSEGLIQGREYVRKANRIRRESN